MRKIFVIAILFVLILAASAAFCGCTLVDNLQDYKDSGEDSVDQEEKTVEQKLELTAEDKGAADDDTVGGEKTAAADGDEDAKILGENEVEVLLYFMSSDGASLDSEKRIIPKEEGLAKATMEQLIAGPKDAALSATLPDTVSLRGINISGGLCTVDFAPGLTAALSEDTDDQTLALYSIVNTLSQFATVDQVKILENGKPLGSVGGMDASAALAPML